MNDYEMFRQKIANNDQNTRVIVPSSYSNNTIIESPVAAQIERNSYRQLTPYVDYDGSPTDRIPSGIHSIVKAHGAMKVKLRVNHFITFFVFMFVLMAFLM